MSSAGKECETLTFDSTDLYLRANSTVYSQPPPISVPFPPLPSSLPHPKLIPQTRFITDGFKRAGEFSVSYFLSHLHSGHRTGPYCSFITSRLLIQVLKVPSAFVVPLPCTESIFIDGSGVIIVVANHCPGAVQYLFKVPADGGVY